MLLTMLRRWMKFEMVVTSTCRCHMYYALGLGACVYVYVYLLDFHNEISPRALFVVAFCLCLHLFTFVGDSDVA